MKEFSEMPVNNQEIIENNIKTLEQIEEIKPDTYYWTVYEGKNMSSEYVVLMVDPQNGRSSEKLYRRTEVANRIFNRNEIVGGKHDGAVQETQIVTGETKKSAEELERGFIPVEIKVMQGIPGLSGEEMYKKLVEDFDETVRRRGYKIIDSTEYATLNGNSVSVQLSDAAREVLQQTIRAYNERHWKEE